MSCSNSSASGTMHGDNSVTKSSATGTRGPPTENAQDYFGENNSSTPSMLTAAISRAPKCDPVSTKLHAKITDSLIDNRSNWV